MKKEIKSKQELLAVLEKIPVKNKGQRNSIVCSLVGHSRIQNACFGYFNCARCGDQLGDTLASIYPFASEAVVVGHNCDTCRENYKKCDWKDKLYASNPFKVMS